MELLIAVIGDPDRTDEILAGFIELGITGATILESEGMGRALSREMPHFAGLQSLISRSRPRNQTVFSVIDDPERADRAIQLIQRVCGGLSEPGTGIAFTVPVSRVVGLAAEFHDPAD
ncbi:MAG: P-II family nitrogen regulator [Gemmatimonadota bacterium]